MNGKTVRLLLATTVLAMSACVPPDFSRTPPPQPTPTPPPSAPARTTPPVVIQPIPEPAPEAPGSVEPVPPPAPPRAAPPVGAAGTALLNESRAHQAAGRYPQAAASIERALRIEPRQPVLWLELGNIRLKEGNYAQAESMARKALSLSAGDANIQARAERLIAESRDR